MPRPRDVDRGIWLRLDDGHRDGLGDQKGKRDERNTGGTHGLFEGRFTDSQRFFYGCKLLQPARSIHGLFTSFLRWSRARCLSGLSGSPVKNC
jgi:hypothetical protein